MQRFPPSSPAHEVDRVGGGTHRPLRELFDHRAVARSGNLLSTSVVSECSPISYGRSCATGADVRTTETLPWAIRAWAEREPDRPFLERRRRRRRAPTASSTRRRCAGPTPSGGVGIGPGDNVPVMVRTVDPLAEEHWLGLGWLRAVHTGVNTDFRGNSLAYVLDNCRAEAHDLRGRVPRPRRRRSPGSLEHARAGDRASTPTLTTVDRRVRSALVAAGDAVGRRRARYRPRRCPSATRSRASATRRAPPGRPRACSCRGDGCGRTTRGSTSPATTSTTARSRCSTCRGCCRSPGSASPAARSCCGTSFKTQHFWDDVRRFGCTTTALIPAMMNWLLDQPPRDDDLDNPLRFVNGAPVVPRVEQFKARFGVQMRTVFGNTEIGTPLVAGPDVSADRESTGQMGRTGLRGQGRRRATTTRCPPGEIGELLVRTHRAVAHDGRLLRHARDRPPRRGATAGSTPATAWCRTSTAGTTSSTGSRTRSGGGARTSRRWRSRPTSTSTRRWPSPPRSPCRRSTARTRSRCASCCTTAPSCAHAELHAFLADAHARVHGAALHRVPRQPRTHRGDAAHQEAAAARAPAQRAHLGRRRLSGHRIGRPSRFGDREVPSSRSVAADDPHRHAVRVAAGGVARARGGHRRPGARRPCRAPAWPPRRSARGRRRRSGWRRAARPTGSPAARRPSP